MGIVSVGTKPELKYGKIIANTEKAPAPSGLLAMIPKKMEHHEIARIYRLRINRTKSQPAKSAFGLKPTRNATATTRIVASPFLAKDSHT